MQPMIMKTQSDQHKSNHRNISGFIAMHLNELTELRQLKYYQIGKPKLQNIL